MELENNAGSWAQRSDSIINLAKALCQTQATVEAVKKDANNPFFKSKYADLASIWHAIREALTSNGLSVLQEPSTEGNKVRITTTLIHTSGEYVRSLLEVPALKVDPQGIGSAITYARRYALGAIVGIAPEDDDGNAASGGGDKKPQQRQEPQRVIPNLKSADQLQADAAAKAFGSDDLPKKQIFHYDLKKFFEGKEYTEIKTYTSKLTKAGGFNLANDLWAVPQHIEKFAAYLVSDESQEVAA